MEFSMDDPKLSEVLRRETELMDANPFDRIAIEKCDSPIEDQFLWEFRKVVHPEVTVRRQLKVETDRGTFILDFVIERVNDRKKIGIECDGRDFHSAERDSKRDGAIIKTGLIDKIYRLRGRDIFCHIYEVLDLLGWCEPWILSLRGKVNLDARTLPEVHRQQAKGHYGFFFPFAAIRMYDEPPYDPLDDDPDSDYTHPRRPILLAWTEKVDKLTII